MGKDRLTIRVSLFMPADEKTPVVSSADLFCFEQRLLLSREQALKQTFFLYDLFGMIRYVPRSDDKEHLQTISYVDPAFSMKKNSARKSRVWAMKEGYVHDQLILVSFYLDSVRHSSHFTRFITRPALCLI